MAVNGRAKRRAAIHDFIYHDNSPSSLQIISQCETQNFANILDNLDFRNHRCR